MSLKEMGDSISGWHIEIVATDLCASPSTLHNTAQH
jgi:hypothetical protein